MFSILDSTAKQLITIYKVTADELCNKFYIESETVMEKMINQQITNLNEINEINKTLIKPKKSMRMSSVDLSEADLNASKNNVNVLK